MDASWAAFDGADYRSGRGDPGVHQRGGVSQAGHAPPGPARPVLGTRGRGAQSGQVFVEFGAFALRKIARVLGDSLPYLEGEIQTREARVTLLERFNDPQRKTEAQNEVQAIADYLASAVGLGGRDRKTSSDAERARSAVTKCIKKAIQKISDAIPSLGYHLVARIKTGYYCSYNPHPERPANWKF